MKKTLFNLDSIDSLIEELSDEELGACSGGLLTGELLTSTTLLSVSTTPSSGVDVHAGPDEVDGPTNLDTGLLSLETDPSVRCRTRGG